MTASSPDGLITLAILAVGGQGGGVLSNWIVEVAERCGYRAQSTSVPGVAQRTGATLYYLEMIPGATIPGQPQGAPGTAVDGGDRAAAGRRAAAQPGPAASREPVLALVPAPGEVDVVVAAELMEAGRAVARGLVTPDRTCLVASSHRVLAVSEKVVPGDGILASDPVLQRLREAAAELVCLDLAAVASRHGTHVSASLLGALAASTALPFERGHYEAVLQGSGAASVANLAAFADAWARVESGADPVADGGRPGPASGPADAASVQVPPAATAGWATLTDRAGRLPPPARSMALAGLARVVDYQDLDYGGEYLQALERVAGCDALAGGEHHGHALTVAVARHLASAMCYDDVIRVADLKTRAARGPRVRAQAQASASAVLEVTEYLHPRAEEVIALLPAGAGRRVQARPALTRLVGRMFGGGRRLRSDRIGGFLTLYALAGLRRWRRSLLRHQTESRHWQAWLEAIERYASSNYGLALETAGARRLVKGYGDTHARGLSRFDLFMRAAGWLHASHLRPDDAVQQARRILAAAAASPEPEPVARLVDELTAGAMDAGAGLHAAR